LIILGLTSAMRSGEMRTIAKVPTPILLSSSNTAS
jgi:hypothetical protein